MRIAITSKNTTQLGIMLELLVPVFGEVKVYDSGAIADGTIALSNDHALIIDYSDESIMEYEVVLDLIGRDEPKCILSEKNLYPLMHDERLSWRTTILNQLIEQLPELASDIRKSQKQDLCSDIWVVGSSSGGPSALLDFLSHLPPLPAALIVTQHIGSDSGLISLRDLLANRQGNWKVSMASDGDPVLPGMAYIIPRDKMPTIEQNRIVLHNYTMPNVPSPCVNASIRSVRRSTNGRMGVVILTGMGDDGAAALREVKQRTIEVLAQEAASCVNSSMPDAARATGAVDRSGTLEEIARIISGHYQ
jgi:chemotaxis response regulator CheB